jgi:hypothetical protein
MFSPDQPIGSGVLRWFAAVSIKRSLVDEACF